MKKESIVNSNFHSKKVCSLLDENPPALIRWGTVIIVAIFLILLLCALSSFARREHFTAFIYDVSSA